MRQWIPTQTSRHRGLGALSDVVDALALPGYPLALLAGVRGVLPGTSLSVYRTGAGYRPQRYMGVSQRRPDTTRDCWRAYMSGPYLRDQTLTRAAPQLDDGPMVCHVTACEVPDEHRSKVYEAHGMAERVSVVRRESNGSVFAINVYRHIDQRPFRDSELSDFADLAPTVLAMTRKHLALLGLLNTGEPRPAAADGDRRLLLALHSGLTIRELDVCESMLRGHTDEAVAAGLGLGVSTVRTYRNRAFNRLGIRSRNELFALARAQGG